MTDAILVLNAGSSSIKFALFPWPPPARATPRYITARSRVSATPACRPTRHQGRRREAGGAIGARRPRSRMNRRSPLCSTGSARPPMSTWSRPATGWCMAARYSPRRSRVTPAVVAELDALSPLAPLHQPHNLAAIAALASCIRSCRRSPASTPPFTPASRRSPPPSRCRARYRRKACGATASTACPTNTSRASCRSISGPRRDGRVVVAHLGNGASMCAMKRAPQRRHHHGLHRARRPGDGPALRRLDPGVMLYLIDSEGHELGPGERPALQAIRAARRLRHQRRHARPAGQPRPEAAEAVDLFVYRIGRELGSLAAALGGLDALVFTGGIGEHAAEIRARVCAAAAWLGISIDAAANAAGGPRISGTGSRSPCWRLRPMKN